MVMHMFVRARSGNLHSRGNKLCAGVGHFRVEDLKQLLHALGLGLSYRTVKELSTFATDLRRSERVYYRVCACSLSHAHAHSLCCPLHTIWLKLQPWKWPA